MSSTLPNRSNGYTIGRAQAATREFFEAVFGDVHQRLNSLELTKAEYDDAIDKITTQALAIVSANITEEVDEQRSVLAQIQANAAEVAEAVDLLRGNVVPAANVRVDPVTGLTAPNVQAALAAIIDGPAFNKSPSAPTPPAGDNDQTIATTEFVQREGVRKTGDRMRGALSSAVKSHGTKGAITEEFKYADANVHAVTVNGALTINPTGLAEGDVMQVNVLYQSGSIAVSGTTQWELGSGAKSAAIGDVGVALTAGAAYRIIFEVVGGVRTGAFQ